MRGSEGIVICGIHSQPICTAQLGLEHGGVITFTASPTPQVPHIVLWNSLATNLHNLEEHMSEIDRMRVQFLLRNEVMIATAEGIATHRSLPPSPQPLQHTAVPSVDAAAAKLPCLFSSSQSPPHVLSFSPLPLESIDHRRLWHGMSIAGG